MPQFQGLSFRPTRSSIPDTPVSRTPMRMLPPQKSKLSSFAEGAMRGLSTGMEMKQRQETVDFEKQKYEDDIKYRKKKYQDDQEYKQFSQIVNIAGQLRNPDRRAELVTSSMGKFKNPVFQGSLKKFSELNELDAQDYKKILSGYESSLKKKDMAAAKGFAYQMFDFDKGLAESWLKDIGEETEEMKAKKEADVYLVYKDTMDKMDKGIIPQEHRKDAANTVAAIRKKYPEVVKQYLEDRSEGAAKAQAPTSKMKDAKYLKTQGFTDREANSIAYDISQGTPRKALEQKLITAIMTKQQPEEIIDKQLDRVPKILNRIFGEEKEGQVDGGSVDEKKDEEGVFALPDGSTATQADLEFTAKKYDMTIEEVKKKLGIK